MILLEGPSTIAGLVLESVIGSSGVIVPPTGYLRGVRDLCDRHGIVYIADEVMVGFGRTGAWFGVDHDGVAPDLMAFAKGVNSGYVPLGGVLVGDAIYDMFTKRPYPAGLTYSGHPLACAAAVGAINAMREEDTVAAAARLGTDILGPGLRGSGAPGACREARVRRRRSRHWRPLDRRTRPRPADQRAPRADRRHWPGECAHGLLH